MAIPNPRLDRQDWAGKTKFLVDHGKLNDYDADGYTPLMKVCTCYEAAKHMIKAGANIYMSDNKWNKSALQIIGTTTKNVSKDLLRLYMCKVEKDCGYNKGKIAKTLINEHWPLQFIVRLGDAGVTRFALEQHFKKDVDAIRMNGTRAPALHVAVANTDIDNVKVLLEYSANVNALDRYNQTSLSYVYMPNDDDLKCAQSQLEILKILLDRKADSNNKVLDNAYDVKNFLQYADKEAIEVLLKYGLDLSIASNTHWRSKIHVIAANKNPGVIEMLYDKSFDIAARDYQGETPLMISAKSGNASAVEFLLNQGADVEAKIKTSSASSQLTALYLTIRDYTDNKGQYKECVQILLERGANAQLACQTWGGNWRTILDLMEWNIDEQWNITAAMIVLAHLALQKTNGVDMTELISSRINAQDNFKDYFESCERQLKVEVYSSLTLFDLLITADNKIERLVCNEEFVSKLNDLISMMIDNYYYYSTLLQNRLTKAKKIVALKLEAANVICKIMKTNYEGFPLIADKIIGYLKVQDMIILIDVL